MIYFLSDFHLGVPAELSSRDRERKIVRFLDQISENAKTIYLLGDVFDYWFEYRSVVPKGYIRLFGKLAELRDKGVKIEFFIGNHDMWMFRYLEEELDIPIHRKPIQIKLGKHEFFIGHGDGLGPGDRGYKFIKAVFSNRFLQRLFQIFHPNFGLWLMKSFSKSSRYLHPAEENFYGPEKERLIQFCEEKSSEWSIDYYVFGHRHLPIDYELSNGRSKYINLGDWLHHYSYACYDGKSVELNFFENENGKTYP